MILGDVFPKLNLLFLSENAHYFQNVHHFYYDFDVDAKTAKLMFKLFSEFQVLKIIHNQDKQGFINYESNTKTLTFQTPKTDEFINSLV